MGYWAEETIKMWKKKKELILKEREKEFQKLEKELISKKAEFEKSEDELTRVLIERHDCMISLERLESAYAEKMTEIVLLKTED